MAPGTGRHAGVSTHAHSSCPITRVEGVTWTVLAPERRRQHHRRPRRGGHARWPLRCGAARAAVRCSCKWGATAPALPAGRAPQNTCCWNRPSAKPARPGLWAKVPCCTPPAARRWPLFHGRAGAYFRSTAPADILEVVSFAAAQRHQAGDSRRRRSVAGREGTGEGQRSGDSRSAQRSAAATSIVSPPPSKMQRGCSARACASPFPAATRRKRGSYAAAGRQCRRPRPALGGGLAAITSTPADIFGLGATRGRIAVGQVADLVLWSGDPLEVSTLADQVWIAGRPIEMKSRQTELRDRYVEKVKAHQAR